MTPQDQLEAWKQEVAATDAALIEAEHELASARNELDELKKHMVAYDKAGGKHMEDDLFVLVTIADTGVKHAWGPYPTRGKAQSQQKRFQRQHAADGTEDRVKYSILKVLGDLDQKTGDWM